MLAAPPAQHLHLLALQRIPCLDAVNSGLVARAVLTACGHREAAAALAGVMP